jgi:hypothetical protein
VQNVETAVEIVMKIDLAVNKVTDLLERTDLVENMKIKKKEEENADVEEDNKGTDDEYIYPITLNINLLVF